jgi:hypothetical protein
MCTMGPLRVAPSPSCQRVMWTLHWPVLPVECTCRGAAEEAVLSASMRASMRVFDGMLPCACKHQNPFGFLPCQKPSNMADSLQWHFKHLNESKSGQ